MKKELVGTTPENSSIQSALIKICQNPDIDPDRLEKFLNMQIMLEERQSRQDFNNAMASFQGACPIIPRTKKVKFTSKSGGTTQYNYAPLDELVFIVKPFLDRYGLSFSFKVHAKNPETNTLLTYIRHKNGHEDVSELEFPAIHDDNRMNISQRRKSALSFAKRAGLENALGIVTQDEDDDSKRAIDKYATPEQLEEIEALLEATGTPEKKFLDYAQVRKLNELSEYEAKKAIKTLRQKRIIQTEKKNGL